MQEFIQQIINGLSAGAIYALIAVGYTMVYGVLRLINFAHGDIYMIGAMTSMYAFSRVLWTPADGEKPLLIGLGIAAAVVALLMVLSRKRLVRDWALDAAATVFALLVVADLCFWHQRGGVAREPSYTTFLLVLLAAMFVCGCLGFAIERLAYRPLRNQPRITALITAIGVSLLLEFGGQRVFGATPQAQRPLLPGVEQAPEMFTLLGASVGKVDVLIFATTLVLMVILWALVQHTRTGMALRAVSFRFDTASLMGININRIISFTFILGSALAAAAGVLVSVKYPQVSPLMGLMPGIKAFVAAVLGGIGNIPGAVAGGLLLGLVETLVAGYLPQGSQYRDGVAFVILIAVLLVKPSGLFGQHTIEKV
ncbi:MAG TPA: branched-chain amino acid ABC transporter permease [Tepidisphaeraceae bacterium]|nr:branched-chain amino acid ABC transporter permease [Tepidisphaeraceae bacterium]